jgi:hypothetical protein
MVYRHHHYGATVVVDSSMRNDNNNFNGLEEGRGVALVVVGDFGMVRPAMETAILSVATLAAGAINNAMTGKIIAMMSAQ